MNEFYTDISNEMKSIINLYNPDYDLLNGAPIVTCTEVKLLNLIGLLTLHVKGLEYRIEKLDEELQNINQNLI